MAVTYTLISSTTLSGSQATITFSNIPSTYTDLVLKTSARSTDSTVFNGAVYVRFNGLSTSIYSFTLLRGNGASATSPRASNTTYNAINNDVDTAGNTANTFTNDELYIPNYTNSAQKPLNGIGVSEDNGTTAYIDSLANLVNLTSAITQIDIYPINGSWASGSSFYLYGIKNA